MNSAFAQLGALVGLRWRMVRSRWVRLGLAAFGTVLPLLMVGSVVGAQLAPTTHVLDAWVVAPTAFLAYMALAVIGPLAAGGGNELFPSSQLVAYPVRPATVFAASVVLAPLNVAWLAQTTGLLALASYAARGHGLGPALVVTVMYAVAITVSGQALAWSLAGLRQGTRGRLVTWCLVLAGVAAVIGGVRVGLTRVLDHAPTKPVVEALSDVRAGHYGHWVLVVGGLIALLAVGTALGIRATSRTLRRPDAPSTRREARTMARRRTPRDHARAMRAVDRASVLRAVSLRRGLLVLAVLPGAAAAAARVQWSTLALTSGLVATGAGLLYGVNVFCLDGAGALWLASQPHDARAAIAAKTRVLAETCLGCVAVAAVAGACRARGSLTAVAVATLVATAAACTAYVVAACVGTSVRRPHRADLTGRRDTPAPPGAMAVQSARLAAGTTLVALIVSGAGETGEWWAPLLMAAAVLLLARRSLHGTFNRYRRPDVRATVASTVAGG